MFPECRIHALPGMLESDMVSQYIPKTNHICTGNAFRSSFVKKIAVIGVSEIGKGIFQNVMYIKKCSLYKVICLFEKRLNDIFRKEK